jgi:hypothetical protein
MHGSRARGAACGAQVGAVVVSPTRELARQIHAVLEPFAASVPGLTTMLLTGGSCAHSLFHVPLPSFCQACLHAPSLCTSR